MLKVNFKNIIQNLAKIRNKEIVKIVNIIICILSKKFDDNLNIHFLSLLNNTEYR